VLRWEGIMARRATWIVLLALVLAPIFGAGAIAPARANEPPPDGTPIIADQAPPDNVADEATPTETPTDTPTETPTVEPTPTDEPSPTATASPTEPSGTATTAPTATTEATSTASPTATSTAEVGAAEVATSTPKAKATVTVNQITVTINCTSEPERIRVTNNGAASIVVQSIGTLYSPLSVEPIAVGKSIGAGGTRQWLAGSTATGSNVLINRLILTNSAYDKEGVVVHTSVGDVQVKCPAKPAPPPVTKDQVAVSINCWSDPERIRVTNNGKSTLTVNSIGTLYNPLGQEPFKVNKTIAAGGSRLWQSGEGATGSYVLTKQYILTNAAYDDEGVKVATSAGTITVRCPAAPPDPFGGAKWIEVNLSTQYLIAWENGVSVNETYVSTGRPGFETPTGTWYVNTKLLSQTMSGCIQGECYYVPDVPWVMYFTDWGHALHGTYWHNNFGHVMSHGCVNLPLDFAEWLYYWTPIGTPVVIHY
jgi:lipoprotein-anchoring transpeptidase ErfK/SrfK